MNAGARRGRHFRVPPFAFPLVNFGHACHSGHMSNDMAEVVAAMIAEQAKAREQLHADRQAAADRKRQQKAVMAERRRWGLRRRHAAKLARNAEAA